MRGLASEDEVGGGRYTRYEGGIVTCGSGMLVGNATLTSKSTPRWLELAHPFNGELSSISSTQATEGGNQDELKEFEIWWDN